MNNGLKRVIAISLTVLLLFTLLPVGFSTVVDGEGSQNVTITFVVNNSNYTNDPGSGYTHLTSPTAITGGELSYESWAGKYKVTGTGTVCSYTIPSGTTLSENNISVPNLSVTNITDSNTYVYTSVLSWVTGAGLVCSNETVFDEDATLYLSLYTPDEGYSIDFVCCEEHQSSINYYCGGLSSIFKLGESLPEENFYDYDDINSHFPNTNHDLSHFNGWQLKNTATGEYVPFNPGMPITAAYTDTANYGSSVKAYAVWQEPAVPVTATFRNGGAVTETRALTAGDALGTLPDLSEFAPTGQTFIGWQYTDANNDLVYATPETVIVADTTYNAVFGAIEYCNVIFHDILPNGTESISIDSSVPIGTSLADLDDAELADGTMISECKWSTLSGNTKTPIDYSTYVVADSVDLYTYTYEASLTLNSNEVVNVTVREGNPIDPSTFVVNGMDLSLYNWSYENSSGNTQALNISNLIANGLTENIEATSNGVLNISGVTPDANHFVDYYVFVDGERMLIKSENVTSYIIGNRHYLSATTLASVYEPYGFQASDLLVGTRYFPHVDYNRADIWADTAVAVIDGCAFSPINTSKSRVEVYYLPNQTLGPTSGPWRNILAGGTETFYSVKVQDFDRLVYSASELPETTYTLNGDTATVTVRNTPATEDIPIKIVCSGVNDGVPILGTDNQDGTTTFVIPNISQPYFISILPDDEKTTIRYNINLPETPIDTEYGTPTIVGNSTHTIFTDRDEASHVVIAPDLTYYLYDAGEKYLGRATFLGWAVNGITDPDRLVQPGTELDLEDYESLINLEAQWKTDYASRQQKTGSMVNFFVSLAAHPDEDNSWTGNIESALFTESVYADDCGVPAGIIPEKNLYWHRTSGVANQYFVLGDTSGDNINDRHRMIVEELSRGYTLEGNDGLDYTFQTSFPTDDMVMRNIRQMIRNGTQIVVNGHTISEAEMTSENFSVRWYVFKYDVSDGWHIDGVLVSKVGTMVVTKTFDGDENLVQAVKNGDYHLDVTASAGAVHTGGELNFDNAVSYDPNTDTYTWEVTVDQFFDYTITESNYISAQTLATTAASYDIHNSKKGCNTDGWQSYTSSGVVVWGQSNYDNDTRKLTVNFLNTYTKPGTLVLNKVDAISGNRMSDVVFDIADSMGNPLILYDRGNGYYDLVPPNNIQTTETTTVTTNFSGQAFLLLPAGTYKLTERVPDGYENPGVITLVLVVDSSTQSIAIDTATAANGSKFITTSQGSMDLTVKNYSAMINLKVEKIWQDGENKPVTFQLYRNGEVLGNPITLDGTVDTVETEPWKHVYTNLPLYVDGAPADYRVHEERIGELHYSSDYHPNGYRYYSVDYSELTYLNTSGQPVTNIDDAVSAYLSVTNKRNTGTLIFKKVDENGEPLQGAIFRLYSVNSVSENSSTNPIDGGIFIDSAISDENGIVRFNYVNEGYYYYIVESEAPYGYIKSDTVYRMEILNGVITMDRWDDTNEAWVEVSDYTVENIRKKTDVIITKQVNGFRNDQNFYFNFTVTSTERMEPGEGYTLSADGLTAKFSLKHGQSVTLKGVPIGAQLTVTELNAEDYEMSITVGDVEEDGEIAVVENMIIDVLNRKNTIPDVGVLLDTLPYALILAGVLVCVVFVIIRKRRNRDDD